MPDQTPARPSCHIPGPTGPVCVRQLQDGSCPECGPDHEIDPPVPLDELRRASTELLLERHVGVPLRALSAELMTEVAQRIATAVADLDALIATHTDHCDTAPCPAHVTLTRIRTTLTGEDTTDATT